MDILIYIYMMYLKASNYLYYQLVDYTIYDIKKDIKDIQKKYNDI